MGIEVALQYISLVVTDLSGAELYKVSQPINARLSDPKVILGRCVQMLEEWKAPTEVRIASIIMAIPGLVSDAKHRIVTAPNLGWIDIEITDFFTSHKYAATPLTVVNEADASAYSVLYKNPGQIGDTSDFLYLSAGVGVGAALIYEGRLFYGQHGWAGEIGHMCVDTSGPKCSCGSNGCLEQYAGLDAMFTRANLPLDESVDPLIEQMVRGNTQARKTVDLCAKSLGTTIANVLNLLDLNTVVMGGHFSQLFDYMEVILMSELKYRLLSSRWSSITVKPGQHGAFTAAQGACLLGFERFLNHPELWAKP
ncbi:ROK family protein [Varibaculum cambriense]